MQLEPLPYMSKRFLLERFLGLTEEEIKENEDMWREERDEPTIEPTGSDLRAVGVSPGAMETDIQTGEEIAGMEPAAPGTPAVEPGPGAAPAAGGAMPAAGAAATPMA